MDLESSKMCSLFDWEHWETTHFFFFKFTDVAEFGEQVYTKFSHIREFEIGRKYDIFDDKNVWTKYSNR